MEEVTPMETTRGGPETTEIQRMPSNSVKSPTNKDQTTSPVGKKESQHSMKDSD